MPVFQYQGVDRQGRPISGAMNATDEANLEKNLRAAGCWLVEAELAKATPTVRRRRARFGWLDLGRITRRDLIDFCTLVSYQTKVGVTLVQALDVAGHDCENPRFRRVIDSVRRDVEAGALFHEALGKHPRVFSRQIVSVVRAGEISSKLPETFGELRDYLEWLDQLIADVRQASIYPSVILGVVASFVLFLFSYIIPKFVILLESTKVPLPTVTQVIFGVSDFAKKTWWIWIIGGFLLTAFVKIGRRMSKKFALWFDNLKLKLPVFGDINWMLAISRFAHNLGLLYKSGIPILTSLQLCREVVGNAVVQDAIEDLERNVAAGGQISEVMRRHPVFPSMLLRMVIMGESTGNLDAALENVSSYYDDVIPRRVKKLFSLLEPALMVFLVFLVGTVALSIFLPIISLMNGIK